MKNGNVTGKWARLLAGPAHIMWSMRPRTIIGRVEGEHRRHVVGSAALAAHKESRHSAMLQSIKFHQKWAPGATAGVIRSIVMSFAQWMQCKNAVSSVQAPLSTRQHLFFLVCKHARCAKGGAVSPLPIVRIMVMKHQAAIAKGSVNFDGSATATISVSSEGSTRGISNRRIEFLEGLL